MRLQFFQNRGVFNRVIFARALYPIRKYIAAAIAPAVVATVVAAVIAGTAAVAAATARIAATIPVAAAIVLIAVNWKEAIKRMAIPREQPTHNICGPHVMPLFIFLKFVCYRICHRVIQ